MHTHNFPRFLGDMRHRVVRGWAERGGEEVVRETYERVENQRPKVRVH